MHVKKHFNGPIFDAALAAYHEALSVGATRCSVADTIKLFEKMKAERDALLAALRDAANTLSAVAGDIEDGGSLDSLRGKYLAVLVDARDRMGAAIAAAEGR